MSRSAGSVITKSSIEEKAIELISSKEDGLYQSELRKLLGIDSSRCSKIAMKLERSGMICRKKPSTGNRRTYLITLCSPVIDSQASFSQVNYSQASYSIVSDSQASYNPITDDEIKHFGKTPSHYNIDTYLTEIYLLYLMRGRETSCHEVDLHEGFSGDTSADELSDGGNSGDNRATHSRHLEDRDCSAHLSSSIPDNGCGKLSERLLRQRDRCDQSAEKANSQQANQLKRCSEMVVGAIRKRLRSRWPSKSILPGLSSN